jgi:hypothetical protein
MIGQYRFAEVDLGRLSTLSGALDHGRSMIEQRNVTHDHVEFSPDGDLAVAYTENSPPGEKSSPKTGHTGTVFMIVATFRRGNG